ncbi:LLM class flavin-dependent oxidoreductase [Deminuibacter soli]|uniref:LLM class flavin-dependent oxidoreductase n=1 Tax=Deminuibacter soli TaxID=2291815 RepID=A0A3E1NGK9_9BACT|nr:LLM class flavin-dependent oxidoreductase [Deminuibacter soli]RFM26981.1 LLM class flavin-dependent oxidoreductase [Deminuibacter soli]
MELGLSTFGDMQPEGVAGGAVLAAQRMAQLLEEAKLADELGLDVFALGEHHRPDFVIAAPEVALAGIATITKKLRLSSAVTVLSSADPVRTFQHFATLDLLSGGRAEIMAGRGSFIESFPLFGNKLEDYDELFAEKLDLLLQINQRERITWTGHLRAPIQDKGIYPRPLQQQLPIWIAVGGTPASMVRAGSLNLPVTIAILGSNPEQFLPMVDLYRKSAERAGHNVQQLQLALNMHMHIADDSQQAADEYWPVYQALMNRIGRERGWSPLSREQYEYMRSPRGSLLVGNPEEVTAKLLHLHSQFNNTRFLGQLITGKDLAHDRLLHSIRLFGTVVAPAVRKALQNKPAEA